MSESGDNNAENMVDVLDIFSLKPPAFVDDGQAHNFQRRHS